MTEREAISGLVTALITGELDEADDRGRKCDPHARPLTLPHSRAPARPRTVACASCLPSYRLPRAPGHQGAVVP